MSTAPPLRRLAGLGCSTGSEDRIDKLIVSAQKAIAASGIAMSPRRVNKIVRRFCMDARRAGLSFHEFLAAEADLSPAQRRRLAEDPDLAQAIAYPDPVGWEAATNVDRERGWR